MISPKGRSKQPVAGLEPGADQDAPDRKAVAHSLGDGDQVRANPVMLEGKELSASAIARLYLVKYEHGSVLPAQAFQALEELRGTLVQAPYPLNALYDHRGRLLLLKLLLQGLQVVQGQQDHLVLSVDRCVDLRVVGHRHSCRSPPVKAPVKGYHLASARMEGSQLQGVLIGLCPRIAKEQAVFLAARDLSKPVGQFFLHRVSHRIRIEAQAS